MKATELARALLDADSPAARQALLGARDEALCVSVVELLKEEADRERLRNPVAALRIAGVATQVAELVQIARCQAIAAWARGNVLIHQGEYAECLLLYQRAALFFEAEGQQIEAARLATNQAWVLKNLGRYQEGVEAALAALEVLRREPPAAFLASTLNALGTLYRLLGRHDEALAAYRESEQIYASLGDEIQRARLSINKANVLETLDRYEECIALLRQAREILAGHERSLEVARADLNLGILHTRLGRYDEALAALDRAERGFSALDNRMEVAVVQLYRADLYAEFNLDEELVQIAAHDWQLFDERGMQWHAARAALYQAVAWRRLGNAERAGGLYQRARAIFGHLGDEVWFRLAGLEEAALWCELGEWERARPVAQETADLLTEKGMPLRAAGSSLLAARCCLALDRLPEAATLYRAALELALDMDVPALSYRAHHGLGRVAEQEERLPEAAEHYREAVETIETLRGGLGVEDFRLGFLEDKIQVYAGAVELYLRLGRLEEAFACVERAKSGALADLLTAGLGWGPGGGEALEARLAALRERLNWHYNRLEGGIGEERSGGRVRGEEEEWRQIAAVEQETLCAWRELQQVRSFYAPAGAGRPWLQARAGDGLQAGEVLVQYYVAGETIHVFVAGCDGLKACLPLDCGISQVAASLAALEITLQAAARFATDYRCDTLMPLALQQLAWLYDDLVAPIEPHLAGGRRLLIAPDGPLFEVPFHALHDGQGYLLERYEMSCAPSASVLQLTRENRKRLVGQGQERAMRQGLIAGCSGNDRLPRIRREVEAVARAMPGAQVLLDEEMTLPRLREVAPGTFVHLAGHAVFRHDNPLFSALQMAGGEWLRLVDMYSLQLRGTLVTLSGCETGRHRLRGGDLLGLSRGLIFAGASALVVSLWPVDDVAAALLMADFYGYLAAGDTAAGALRRAQLGLCYREEEREGVATRPYLHPFYWAPFCLLGMPDLCLQVPG